MGYRFDLCIARRSGDISEASHEISACPTGIKDNAKRDNGGIKAQRIKCK